MGLSSKEVSGDSLDWSQIGNLEIPKPIGEARSQQQQQQQQQQREERQKVPPLKCPRCDSTNTKFCYYNNYSRQQPRHFCRACRRHWTEGGTLRNVPVGGGRKNKRSKINHTANANDDGNQQQVAVPFGGIFPDIFSQVFFHSPPPLQPLLSSDYSGESSGSFVDSLLSAPPFLSEFGGTEPVVLSSCDNAGNPFSISNSSSSSIGDDGLLTMMDGSTTSTWLQEPPALPASYWSCWDGDFADQ